MIKQKKRARLRDYMIFIAILSIPAIIVFEYKRSEWVNCGKYIHKQNQIFNSKIKPKINTSEKILNLANLQSKYYINNLDVKSSFFLNDLKDFAEKYNDLSINRKKKLPLELKEIVEAYNEILKAGESMRDDAICRSSGNMRYRKWMKYPLKILIDEVNKQKYYDSYNL